MASTPLVSVVIPTHNRADVVPRAIRSALGQSVTDIEVIVVDDASSDDTSVVVSAVGDPRVRYIRRNVRGGGGAARNTGLDAVTGDVVAFLDSDDEWLPQKLESQLSYLGRSEKASLVMCGFVRVQRRSRRRAWPAAMGAEDATDRLLSLRGGPMTCSLFLVSRSALQESGVRFDPTLPALQDLDFALQLSLAGFSVVGPLEVLVKKYRDPGKAHVFNPRNEALARRRMIEKYESYLMNEPCARHRQRHSLATALLRNGHSVEAVELLEANANDPIATWSDRVLAKLSRHPRRARALDWVLRKVGGVQEGRLRVRACDLAHDLARLLRP